MNTSFLRMAVTAVTIAVALSPSLAAAETTSMQHDHHCGGVMADSHAPIGVMGDHVHKEGEWMLSYRYMRMGMSGMRDGTSHLTPAQTLALGYMVTPLRMTSDMHMFGAMYAPSDKLTLMAMLPYLDREMDLVTGMGAFFTTRSSGFGDARLGGLWALYADDTHNVHLNAGLSLPTGSVNRRDDTPMAANAKLPYPMQLGSGTWDILPGLTYTGHKDQWGWGAQYNATFRTGRNSEGYTLGDAHVLSGWTSYRWADWISTSVRLTGRTNGKIDGSDSQLNPMMVPTADADNQGGERLDLALGVNLAGQGGALRGHRLAIELHAPVYENANGVQMDGQYMFVLGWQKAF